MDNNSKKINKLTQLSLFLAIGIILNLVEAMIPLPISIPGVKLGLANTIGLVLLYYYSEKEYLLIGLARVIFVGLLRTGLFSMTFVISLGGWFLSSLIVYGESKSFEPVVITKDTKPVPNGFYGRSKLEAEDFKVAAIRPPMVYGKHSKGNYPKLAKLAAICPIFPDIKNERSMIHIEQLCECIRLVIEKQANGIFMPQNKEYVSTTQLVQEIAKVKGKKVYTTKLFNPLIRIMAKKISFINKVFGTLVYAKECSDCFDWNYCIYSFEETIERTEKE